VRDLIDELTRCWRSGAPTGLATVVSTWRSAPRPPGAAMAVGPDGGAIGSVSGGCVEGAVYELARAARDGARPGLHRFGVSDDDAFGAGLTCGGIIELFIERIDRQTFPELGALAADLAAGQPIAVATVIADSAPDEDGTDGADAQGTQARQAGAPGTDPLGAGARVQDALGTQAPEAGPPGGEQRPSRSSRVGRVGRHLVVRPAATAGSLGSARLDAAVRDDARGLLAQGRSAILRYGPDGERRGDELAVFVAAHTPPPRMIVFGAIDFAAALARLGAFLGYRVTVCDARATFATPARFPGVDELVVDWPHRYLAREVAAGAVDERAVVCVLTHDPKFDVPVLELALRLPLAYLGAMGSRRTNDERTCQLRARGLTEAELARLRAPLGLDLGARTPQETAVSIAAEIVARRWGGTGAPLRATTGAIHHEAGSPGEQPAGAGEQPATD